MSAGRVRSRNPALRDRPHTAPRTAGTIFEKLTDSAQFTGTARIRSYGSGTAGPPGAWTLEDDPAASFILRMPGDRVELEPESAGEQAWRAEQQVLGLLSSGEDEGGRPKQPSEGEARLVREV
jgi:hypothetical protein